MRQPEALRRLQEEVASLYLVHGTDAYQVAEFLAALRTRLVPPGTEAFNESLVEPGPDQVRQGLLLARTPPLLSDRRLVVLKECRLLGPGRAGGDAAPEDGEDRERASGEAERLLEYLAAPAPFSCLVLHVPGDIDRRRRFTRALLEKAVEVECSPLTQDQALSWLEAKAAALGKRLDREAAQALVEKVGTDLHALSAELEKLALYVGAAERIDTGAVLAVVPGTAQVQVFDLVDAVAEGRLGQAEALLRRMLASGEAPLRLLATLASHFRRLLEARSLRERGLSPAAIARQKGQHPRYWEKLDRQARRLRREQLQFALEVLLEADLQLKSGADGPLVLETLLFDLVGAA